MFSSAQQRGVRNYFGLQRTVLQSLGVSFSGYDSYLYILYSVLWLSSVAITYTVIELYEVYMYMDNLDTLVSILSYLGTDLLGVVKVSVLLYHRKKIGATLDNLEGGVFAPNEQRGGKFEQQLIKKIILVTNSQTSFYYFCVIMVTGIGAFGTLANRLLSPDNKKWEMPYMPFSWFDVTKSPNYEIVWLYQSVWRTLYALIVSSTDSLIGAVLAHISVQCQILQNSIRRMINNAYREGIGFSGGHHSSHVFRADDFIDGICNLECFPSSCSSVRYRDSSRHNRGEYVNLTKSTKSKQYRFQPSLPYVSKNASELPPEQKEIDASLIPWRILEKHMKDTVNYHLAIIKVAEQFEDLFNMLVLTVFAATLFILCFIMYHASLFDLISMRAAQDFSYVALVMVQVFLYCYWGNEVTLESQKIADACWDVNFIGTDVRFQKGLALVIRRCQKPIILTAGKFTDLSLRTYVWLIRASYSYYMVLRNHHQL